MDRIEQMPVYQLCFALAVDVERATRSFGAAFQWLRIQVLKSSESVCANMSEGYYAQYSTEYLQCLYRCRREARESMVHVRYASAVGQLAAEPANGLLLRYEEATRQLAGLITSIERKISEHGKSKTSASVLREIEEEYLPFSPDPPVINGPLSLDPRPLTLDP